MMPYPLLGLIALLCFAWGGCTKKNPEPALAPLEDAPAPAVVETSEPRAGEAATATPAPVPRRLAPEGTYFLLVKKSIESADGILGFKPGTVLKKEADGQFTAEGHRIEVNETEITNDLDIALQYAGADAQRQAVLRQAAAIAAMTPPPSNSPNRSSSAPPRPASPGASSSSGKGDYLSATRRTAGGLESSSALGAGHTKTQDGWLWQKDAAGNWRRVKPLR